MIDPDRKQDLFELAKSLGVTPLEVVSWVAEGCPCFTPEGVLLDPLTPAQRSANRGLAARIRAARAEADFAALCLEVEAAAEAGDLPGRRGEALLALLATVSTAAGGAPASQPLPEPRGPGPPPVRPRGSGRPRQDLTKLTVRQLAILFGVSVRCVRAWLEQGCPCARDAEGKAVLDAVVVARWHAERELAALGQRAAARSPFPALAEAFRRAESFGRLAELSLEVAACICNSTVSLKQAAALKALLLEAHVRLRRDREDGATHGREAS